MTTVLFKQFLAYQSELRMGLQMLRILNPKSWHSLGRRHIFVVPLLKDIDQSLGEFFSCPDSVIRKMKANESVTF
jgi:hypothetical protein